MKAFDSVDWRFLSNTLQAMGFPAQFIKWLLVWITTQKFSISLNGSLVGSFPEKKKGIRQIPYQLSLLLLLRCFLSQMLNRAAAEKRIVYHSKCAKINLTHLCFADDLIFFAKADLFLPLESLSNFCSIVSDIKADGILYEERDC